MSGEAFVDTVLGWVSVRYIIRIQPLDSSPEAPADVVFQEGANIRVARAIASHASILKGLGYVASRS